LSADALEALTSAGIAATAADSFGPTAVDVPAEAWVAAHEVLRLARQPVPVRIRETAFDYKIAALDIA